MADFKFRLEQIFKWRSFKMADFKRRLEQIFKWRSLKMADLKLRLALIQNNSRRQAVWHN